MLRSRGTASPIHRLKLDCHFRRYRKRNKTLQALLVRVWSHPLECNWSTLKSHKDSNQACKKKADGYGHCYAPEGKMGDLQHCKHPAHCSQGAEDKDKSQDQHHLRPRRHSIADISPRYIDSRFDRGIPRRHWCWRLCHNSCRERIENHRLELRCKRLRKSRSASVLALKWTLRGWITRGVWRYW